MCQKTARTWHEIRHPITGRLIVKYCPQTMQIEVMDKKQLAVVDLPKP